MTDCKFEGWQGHDVASAEGKLVWAEFKPKAWEEDNIDIRITHCGVCASDLATLRSGWVRKTLVLAILSQYEKH